MLRIAALEDRKAWKATLQGNGLDGVSGENAQLQVRHLKANAFQIALRCAAIPDAEIPDHAARADTGNVLQPFQGDRLAIVRDQILLHPPELHGGWGRGALPRGKDFWTEAGE